MEIIEDYVGKTIKCCTYWGNRINFNSDNFSLCHEAEVGVYVMGKIEDFSRETYEKALLKHIKDINDGNSKCIECSKCKEHIIDNDIKYVTINTSSYCNSECIYCNAHSGREGSGYNPIPLLNCIRDYINPKCYFDWGGGEPTLNPFFEECIKWISENGYIQRINTNGIKFSEQTQNALREGRASLRLSLDAGSKECFSRVKGHDNYEEVWDNIKKYRSVSEEVYLKYNIFNMNSDLSEIDTFLNKSKEIDIKHIIIDAEISCYQPNKNAGPFYYTQKEHDASHYLYDRAKSMDMDVIISGYAYSVRPEYDNNNCLKLPDKYFNNIDNSIVSTGIYAKMFPNNMQLITYLKGKKVVVYGAGHWGQKLVELLSKNTIKIYGIIDNDISKVGRRIMGIEIQRPESFYAQEGICYLIIGAYAKEQLKDINKYSNPKSEVVWVKLFENDEE